MSEPLLERSRIEFSIQTEAGELYIVETSTSLKDEDWEPAPFAKMPNDATAFQSLEGNGARITIYLDVPTSDRRFYRVTLRCEDVQNLLSIFKKRAGRRGRDDQWFRQGVPEHQKV